MAKVVIISGSATVKSRLDGVLERIETKVREAGFDVQTIKVRDLPPEALIYGQFDHPAVVEANQLLEESTAVIIASPIYKASYTGVLKTFLDLIPQKGLEGKVVLPIAIGGTISHLLAIDHSFKPVLSALGAYLILQGVFVQDTQVERSEEGYKLDADIVPRLTSAAETFIREVQLRNTQAEPSIGIVSV